MPRTFGSLSAYEPGLMDQARWWLQDKLTPVMGGDARRAGDFVQNKVMPTAEYLPGVGDAMEFGRAKDAYDKGNYGQAAAHAAFGSIGMVPGLGDMAAAGGKAIFAGVGAATANKALLKKAQDMFNAGADQKQIWDQTGWAKGPDGKWRFEIDDSAAMYNPQNMERGLGDNYHTGKMSDAMSHDALYAAYPDLADTKHVYYTENGRLRGQYNPESRFMNERVVGWNSDKSTALHELQHAIQQREGFAQGGTSKEYITPSVDDINFDKISPVMEKYKLSGDYEPGQDARSWLKGLHDDLRNFGAPIEDTDPIAQEYMRIQREIGSETQQYKRLAGEVEARNVQTRMDWDKSKREKFPPFFTEDISRNQQIIVPADGGNAYVFGTLNPPK